MKPDFVDSETLETIPIGRNMDMNCFLHGFCDIFALALHDTLGYDLNVASAENDEENNGPLPWEQRLVHVYCSKQNTDYLIDVRGVSDDHAAFFEEFEDFMNPPEAEYTPITREKAYTLAYAGMEEEPFQWLYDTAVAAIVANPARYKI